ncbi:MAG: hypothetical protein VYA34_14135 [Myxococcota bacterium]|nr:hypothetical protein [Myxococcota bacterium]
MGARINDNNGEHGGIKLTWASHKNGETQFATTSLRSGIHPMILLALSDGYEA